MKAQYRVKVGHKEPSGQYLIGDVEAALSSDPVAKLRGKVNLILTSPPFPLNHKKSYGNLTGEKYLAWINRLAPTLSDLLAPVGSIVVEIGNSWEPGRPVQSLLHLKSLMAFVEAPGAQLRLCQQFVCYNPARLPSPAQWVTVERIRTTDSFTHVWWMSRTDRPKADNKRVLRPYSPDMLRIIRNGKYNDGNVLRAIRDRHTATIQTGFEQDILDHLRAGKIVIVDLSLGDPNIQALFSDRICRAIFADAMGRFTQASPNCPCQPTC